MKAKQLRPPPSVTMDARGRLLQAAAESFSERGYEGATVREICHKAGVNIALVKYHFGDKLQLYRAVIRYTTDADAKFTIVQQALHEHSDPAEALRQIIRDAIERLSSTKELFGLQLRLMLRETANPASILAGEVEGAIEPLYNMFCSLIGKIIDLPANHTTSRLCAHSVMGQVAHYIHARPAIARLWPELEMSPKQIEMIATHIADFSLAYLNKVKQEDVLYAKRSQRKRR